MQADQFVRNFENAVEGIEPESLNPKTEFHSIPQMDSLGLLCLMAMIDCEYDVQIPGASIKACVTLEDIYNLVASKVAEKAPKAA
jgi:acyl carrier protein